MKKIAKKLLLVIVCSVIFSFPIFLGNISISASEGVAVDGFNIIPALDEDETSDINEKITEIGSVGGEVINKYNEIATGLTTSQQIASGIMNRDTIMNYLVFVVQFLSQLGLLVGAGFIVYAGYTYMLSVFNNGKKSSTTVVNAIVGILIIIFSYAIMRILTSFIGLT